MSYISILLRSYMSTEQYCCCGKFISFIGGLIKSYFYPSIRLFAQLEGKRFRWNGPEITHAGTHALLMCMSGFVFYDLIIPSSLISPRQVKSRPTQPRARASLTSPRDVINFHLMQSEKEKKKKKEQEKKNRGKKNNNNDDENSGH